MPSFFIISLLLIEKCEYIIAYNRKTKYMSVSSIMFCFIPLFFSRTELKIRSTTVIITNVNIINFIIFIMISNLLVPLIIIKFVFHIANIPLQNMIVGIAVILIHITATIITANTLSFTVQLYFFNTTTHLNVN